MNTAQFVVTGTDTNVGKTIFAASLTAALKANYWKPVQAGVEDGTDSKRVKTLSGLPDTHILPEAYCLNTPCSPHLAAEIEDIEIDLERLNPPTSERTLIIEGAGGALVPINRQITYADIFARWQIPTIIVARTALGTINHSIMTIEALRNRDVPIHGVAFIGDEVADSQLTICEMGRVKSLGRLPIIETLNTETIKTAFHIAFKVEDFQS